MTEWRFAPGAETGPHRHEMDYVVVPLYDGTLRIQTGSGTSDSELRRGVSYARLAGVEHNVVNANSFEFAFIEIELKTDDLAQRRAAVILEHMASENEHRFDDTIATFVHPHYELVANGLQYDGEDDVRRYLTTSRQVVPDQTNELISMHCSDNAVIVEFWLLGTVTGRFADHPFRARMCAVFEFEEGSDLIACERVYWDRQTITDQLTGPEPTVPN